MAGLPLVVGDPAATLASPVMLVDPSGNPISSTVPTSVLGVSGCFATASFTPAAAAYSANDIMGASAEFAFAFGNSVAIPAGSLIRILTAITRIDVTALQASEAGYQLQGYSATQPSAQADNDAWTLASGDLATYRGAIPLGTPVDLGAALYIKSGGIDLDVRLITSSLWARLQTLAGFTATAVARQVTLYGIVL
ncbi:hypothetical protein [Mesorhizobium wenxiniae]|uniref:Uncharacterized protein n=1 Tax=Mesorhizobium wenxiniae TaxID=2014805 RepID=A0A271KFG4_9HYPH|nr:hypothetical protein [Mesorhizobium wenxiniae]PAP94522.1 hypothetical protein CIT31_16110 [Mesorhizobium wenxiniae]